MSASNVIPFPVAGGRRELPEMPSGLDAALARLIRMGSDPGSAFARRVQQLDAATACTTSRGTA